MKNKTEQHYEAVGYTGNIVSSHRYKKDVSSDLVKKGYAHFLRSAWKHKKTGKIVHVRKAVTKYKNVI